jgi:hypothetical protein
MREKEGTRLPISRVYSPFMYDVSLAYGLPDPDVGVTWRLLGDDGRWLLGWRASAWTRQQVVASGSAKVVVLGGHGARLALVRTTQSVPR